MTERTEAIRSGFAVAIEPQSYCSAIATVLHASVCSCEGFRMPACRGVSGRWRPASESLQ